MKPGEQNDHGEVRKQVDDLFRKNAAFQALPPDERAEIAQHTADIVEAMASNKLSQVTQRPSADPYAVPMIGQNVSPVGGPPTGGQNQVQFTGGAQPDAQAALAPQKLDDFGAALAVGVGQAGELLRQVNFPAFVAELIQGVFQAVVDASIQQLRAYGELVQSVAMSLSDFRDANVSPNQGRDHLVSKFPNLMQINITDSGPRVGLRPNADTDDLPDIAGSLGLDEDITDLDDEFIEETLVPAARNDLARSRQTLLATMLLMGINRIVVTDGKINARLKFNFRTRDSQTTHAQEYDYDNMGTTTTWQSEHDSGNEGEYKWTKDESSSGDYSRWSKGKFQYASTPAVYLTNVEDKITANELEAQAKLSGDVSLNFRSETVDLNQLASTAEIFQLERVRSAGRGAPGAPIGTPQAEGQPGGTPPEQQNQQQAAT